MNHRTVGLAVFMLMMQGLPVQGQVGRGAAPLVQTQPTAQASAPYDPTGYWVSMITNNWRTRMVPPPLGDYRDIPLNAAGRKLADAWDPARDEAARNECKHYGAGSILFQPSRLRVAWQDDNTLRMDIDSGSQTRFFRFGNGQAGVGKRSWQGDSVAVWQTRQGRGATPAGRYLQVTTTNMLPGYLRKNGVPYSERASLTEYFDLFKERDGTTIMIVTIAVEDPVYLDRRYVVVSHFKKQADAGGFEPTPCSARW